MWFHRLIVAVAAYALFAGALGTLYIVEQQAGRNAVEDAPRILLSAGSTVGQPSRVDLSRYLGTFWVEYDASGVAVTGNGYLRGGLADVPRGVLDHARATGEDAVTWQPERDLRFAIVAHPTTDGGVVVAGQSLRATEQRSERALLYVLIALACGALVVAVAVAVHAAIFTRSGSVRWRSTP